MAARKNFDAKKIKGIADRNPEEAREQLDKNIMGIGMKEASHFLRNVGYNPAIIDFHILDLLKRYKIIVKNIKLNAWNYQIMENKLKGLAEAANLSLAELDLYL